MSALRAVTPDNPTPSIQGEQLLETARRQWASQEDVDQYAAEAEGTGKDICRQRNGHRYPPMPDRRPFDRNFSPAGYLIRRTDPCLDCGLAYQVQRYEPYEAKQGRKWVIRYKPAYNTTEYLISEDGDTYKLTSGKGYIHPRSYRDARATQIVHADPEMQLLGAEALKQRQHVLALREQRAQTKED
jgi:hypothetical protein